MALQPTEASLLACCACRSWAAALAQAGPYTTLKELIEEARRLWWQQTPITGWLEAFAAHPRIGDLQGLREKYGGAFGAMSQGEQAGAAGATEEVLQALADWNARYEAKFGHVFIICASGRSAEEMLAAVQRR